MGVRRFGDLIRHNLIVTSIIVVVVAGGTYFFILRRSPQQASSTSFATLTANVVGFQSFEFNVLDGFSVEASTVSFSQGVLLFQLSNNQKQTIAVTEQLLPQNIADNVDPNATKVDGADGTAIVTYNETTTTGALFSNTVSGRQTMVLLNTTAPISQSTVEDLLRGLRPTN